MTETRAAFIRMIHEEPSEANRLVFADWLEEQAEQETDAWLAAQLRAGRVPSFGIEAEIMLMRDMLERQEAEYRAILAGYKRKVEWRLNIPGIPH
jgi:uncharacterized protein (TIGR02996 family)